MTGYTLLTALVYSAVAEVTIISDSGRPGQDSRPEIPPAITGGIDSPFSAETVQDIVGRRRLGLPIPGEYYEQCHFWVNAVRAREGLPALRRWTEYESCSDAMSEYDYAKYRDESRPHAAFADGVGCNFRDAGATTWSQNSCPMWGNTVDSIENCTVRMWDEKTDPGVDPATLECLSGVRSDCGHYYNLRGGGEPGWYNKYTRVACGFYVDPTEGDLYINQNFANGGDFLCGGSANTKPQGNLVVDDCTEPIRNYEACGDLDGIVEPKYYEYGCLFKNCDIEYSGECTNLLTEGFDACSYFDIQEPSDCGGWFYFSNDGPRYDFADYCRESCQTCACEALPDGMTYSPTPEPTAPCDPAYSGECEDETSWICDQLVNPNPDISCEGRRYTFQGTSHNLVDTCRKSCKACSCDVDTPAPTNRPTPQPTNRPTPQPTNQPSPEPTSPPVPSPTSPPVPSPTNPPVPSPTNPPVPSPTSPPVPSPTSPPVPSPTSPPVPSPTSPPVPSPTNPPVPSPTTPPVPSPTTPPVPSPTSPPVPPPTPSPLGCDNLQVGIPRGTTPRVPGQVANPCDCATSCAGTIGFFHHAKRKRCWCVQEFDGRITNTGASGNKRRFYQLLPAAQEE